jgi:polyhydroxyalkanoate synthesis regulator phasin
MSNRTLESQPKSNQAAISTPAEINLVTLVETVAKRKSTDGVSFTGKKGKQTLFSAVCSAYRSMRGLPKFTDDGKPMKLTDSVCAELQAAIATFWTSKANEIVGYGEIVSYRKDVAAMKLTDKGEAKLHLTATLRAKRQCADLSEHHRTAKILLDKAKKKMDYMLDNAGDYSRDDMEEQRVKITALELQLEAKEMPAND